MEAFATSFGRSEPPSGRRPDPSVLRVLLVEDDAGDALLVDELLADVDSPIQLTWVQSIAAAEPMLANQDCVLLDLGLPDATGLQAVQRLQTMGAAVVVLTGLAGEQHAIAAVAAGAQDYLVKGQVDGALLARVIRYAVERVRSEEVQRLLREERLHAEEKARLERGLLPTPLLFDSRVGYAARYQPGQQRMLLGGDFYDVVQTADGTVHVVIGDVCGHGPDEAALGVCLRVAWRTLVLAGRPADEVLDTMQQVLVHERHMDALFATMCMMTIAPDLRSAWLRLAGHPAPLIIGPAGAVELTAPIGVPLGIRDQAGWPAGRIELGEQWSVLLYTDGLIDARIGEGPDRLGMDGLTELLSALVLADPGWRQRPQTLLDTMIARVRELDVEGLVDDVAALLVTAAGVPDQRRG